jgi:hypothetical protein
MGTEYLQEKFYKDTQRLFVSPHEASKIALEHFLSEVVFKKDKSRIIYSTDDICFRKRIEQLDLVNGWKPETLANIVSLQLPFASYHQETNFEEDDRVSSVQANQMVLGHYEEALNAYLKAMAVLGKYKAICWFGRDDDARLAYQLLQWEQYPKSPIWLYTAVNWCGVTLLMPCFTTIDKIEFNPNYKESDWLEKSRIIPINIDFSVRAYTIRVPKIEINENEETILPLKFKGLYGEYPSPGMEEVVLTEKVVLDFGLEKGWFETAYSNWNPNSIVTRIDDTSQLSWELTSHPFEPNPKDTEYVKNGETEDILKGYLNEKSLLKINQFSINENLSTSNKLVLEVYVTQQTLPYFSFLKLIIPGRQDIIIDHLIEGEGVLTQIDITDLHPASEYHIIGLFSTTDGNSQMIRLTGITKDSPDNKAPTIEKKKKYPQIIGRAFGDTRGQYELSDERKILKFTIDGVDASINQIKKLIEITLPNKTDITNITPTIIVSNKATVIPSSSTINDFTKNIIYKVKAEDGSVNIYKVKIYQCSNDDLILVSMNDEAFMDDDGDILTVNEEK